MPIFCRKGATRRGNMKIVFTDGGIFNSEQKQTKYFHIGEAMEIRLKYKAEQPEEDINFTLNITRDDGVYCFGTTALSGLFCKYQIVKEKEGEISFEIEKNNLLEGKYYLDIGIQNLQEEEYDYISNAMSFRVQKSQDAQQGIVYLPGHWVSNRESIQRNDK